MTGPRDTVRLDKWLWHARFFKTRSLAATMVSGGKVRVNGTRVSKPATPVGAGDTLTFSQGDRIRVVQVLAPSQRRGPAVEAALLYDDQSPPFKPDAGSGPGVPPNPRYEGKGRPEKRDRRALDLSRRKLLE